jgi:uncharacterized protein (TIGR02246 family)
MKKILCLCTFFVFVTLLNAQVKNISMIASDKKEILQIIEQWREGYNSGNASKVAALYKEDAYYLTQHFITGIVKGRAAIQAYVQLGVDAKYHIDSIHAISLDCTGNFAYAITRYDAINNGQLAFGVNIVVLKKIGGKWLIVAHEAAVPDPSQAIQSLDTIRFH